jgi:hypothetical protein
MRAMNDAIQFHSRVGDDGVLNVRLDLGPEKAQKQVVVTIEPMLTSEPVAPAVAMAWPDFVGRTYGSCAGSGLERHEQGDFESREQYS